MDSAIVAFHSIRDNLKLKGRLGLDQGLPEDPGSEFVSEYSQDFNSVDSDTCRKGILKARSKYVQDTLVIPPEILEKISNKDQFFHSGRNTRARDSGFNSEYNSSVLASEKGSCVYYPDQNSNAFESEQGSNVFGSEQPSVGPSEAPSAIFGSELGSNYLEHYGLDGPLEVYTPLPATSPPPPIRNDPPPTSVTSIATKKKKQQEAKQATIRQHYYPEGGWGWVILFCALCVQVLSHGLQLSFGVLLLSIIRRWGSEYTAGAGWIGSISICVSLLLSPVTVATCRLKSTRLTAVIGGFIASLGLLFTSFASQFHQIVISYGFIVGLGVSFVRDASTLMVAQYFKRKRELVEVVVVAGSGLGIIIISVFMRSTLKEVGWRLGLQAITGVCTSCSILGIFYRSATLYHPQRRAILHLKSQKRKIKDKNKALEEKLPFFDFSSLRSRTFQIILLSTSISSFGIFTPFILLVYHVEDKRLEIAAFSAVQTHLGSSWILGVLIFGFIMLCSSRECHIGRQYLCQLGMLVSGISILVFASLKGEQGFLPCIWVFGVFSGGYHYSLKMYVFEKVRARNFARAWGFLQASQSVPVLFGVPLTQYLNNGCESRAGFYFSGVCILTGFLTMFLINVHKNQLRRLRHSRHVQRHGTSVKSTSTKASDDSFLSPGPDPLIRRLSFEGEEDDLDILPAMALLHNQQFLQDIMEHEHNAEMSLSDLGLADMDIQDRVLLDNITSCAAVDNYLMLDEYEQNLIKEHEGPVSKRIRKWSLAKQQSQGQWADGGQRLSGGRLGVDRGRLDEEQETKAGQVAEKRDKVLKIKPGQIFTTRAITTIIEDEG